MQRDFDQPLLDFEGRPFEDNATLKTVAFSVLMASLDGDAAQSLDERLKQFALVQRIHKGGIVEISAEEIALIKKRAAKSLTLLAVGRVCELLEAEPSKGR